MSDCPFSEQKLAQKGENVLLFANVDDQDNEVSLYINGDKSHTLIVTWTIENENIQAAWMTPNYRKIYMDRNRNIWVDNVDVTYKGTYIILDSPRPRVELIIFEQKLAQKGENVLLFANVDDQDKEVSIYINGDKTATLIVTWTFENGNIQAAWMTKNYRKIYMDRNRNIWVKNVDVTYKGTYIILDSPRPRVELIIFEEILANLGEKALLFANVDDQDKEVSLYINRDKTATRIVTWTFEVENIQAAWLTTNYRKIYMDRNRNIWVDNVDVTYKGIYIILDSPRPGVELNIFGYSHPLEPESSPDVTLIVVIGLIPAAVICAAIAWFTPKKPTK